MHVDGINLSFKQTITNHRCDPQVTEAVTRFIQTLLPGGVPTNPPQLNYALSDLWMNKGLLGKEIIPFKEIITTDNIPFVLTPEQQITLKALIECATDAKTGILDYGHLKMTWQHGVGCPQFNYLTSIYIELRMLLEEILKSGVPLTKIDKVELDLIKLNLSRGFFQIGFYLNQGSKECDTDGTESLNKALDSIPVFLQKFSKSNKEKIHATKIEILTAFLKKGITERTTYFPILLLPTEVEFSPSNFIKYIVTMTSYAIFEIGDIAGRIQVWKKQQSLKIKEKTAPFEDKINNGVKIIVTKYSEIRDVFKKNGKLYTFNPYCTKFEDSIVELQDLINNKVVKLMSDIGKEGSVLLTCTKKITEITKNDLYTEAMFAMSYNLGFRSPHSLLTRVISGGQQLILTRYKAEEIKQEVNSMIDLIPKDLLANQPHHTQQKICHALILYVHSLCLDIDKAMKRQGDFFNSLCIGNLFSVVSRIITCCQISRDPHEEENHQNLMNLWREISFDPTIDFLESKAKEFLIEAVKNKQNPNNEYFQLRRKCVNLNNIFKTTLSFLLLYSFKSNENPLSKLSTLIPSTHSSKDTFPPFVMSMANQVVPILQLIIIEMEQETTFVDKKMQELSKEQIIPLILNQELKNRYSNLKKITLKTLSLLPQKITTRSELKELSIILNRYVNHFLPNINDYNFDKVTSDKKFAQLMTSALIERQLQLSGFIPLRSINEILSMWLFEEEVFNEIKIEKKKNVNVNMLGSLVDLDDNIEIPEEESPVIHTQQISLQIEPLSPVITKKPVLDALSIVSLEMKVADLLLSTDQSKEVILALKNIQSYLTNLYCWGGDSTIKTSWPESIQFSIAFQYCEELRCLLEQLFKLILSESIILQNILEQRNEQGQMLKSSHDVNHLLNVFIENYPGIDQKMAGFGNLVRSLHLKGSLDRVETLNTVGKFGRLLTDLNAFIVLTQSIKDKNLDVFESTYCTKKLGKDSTQWKEKLDQKRENITGNLQDIGIQLITFIDSLFPIVFGYVSTQVPNVFMMAPYEIKRLVKKSSFKEPLEEIESQYKMLEGQLSSKKLQELLSKDSLDGCQQILESLKQQVMVDLSPQNRKFAFAIADMRMKRLERLLEETFKVVLKKLDPDYLEEEYVTENQTRPMSISHRLDFYLDRLRILMPNLEISNEAVEEIRLLTDLWTVLHHYRSTEIDNSLHTILQALQVQSRMSIELAKKHLPDKPHNGSSSIMGKTWISGSSCTTIKPIF